MYMYLLWFFRSQRMLRYFLCHPRQGFVSLGLNIGSKGEPCGYVPIQSYGAVRHSIWPPWLPYSK